MFSALTVRVCFRAGPSSSWRAQFVDGHVYAALRCLPQWYGPGVPPLPEDERAAALELADAYRALLHNAATTLQHDRDLLGEPSPPGIPTETVLHPVEDVVLAYFQLSLEPRQLKVPGNSVTCLLAAVTVGVWDLAVPARK